MIVFDNCFAATKQEKICLQNKSNEKLVGLLHDTGSADIVVLCHGFRSSKVPFIFLFQLLTCEDCWDDEHRISLQFSFHVSFSFICILGVRSYNESCWCPGD